MLGSRYLVHKDTKVFNVNLQWASCFQETIVNPNSESTSPDYSGFLVQHVSSYLSKRFASLEGKESM